MTGRWSAPFTRFDQKQIGSKPFNDSRERTTCHSLPLSIWFPFNNRFQLFILLLGLGTAFKGLSVSTFNPLWGCASLPTITVPWFICALGHKCHLSRTRHLGGISANQKLCVSGSSAMLLKHLTWFGSSKHNFFHLYTPNEGQWRGRLAGESESESEIWTLVRHNRVCDPENRPLMVWIYFTTCVLSHTKKQTLKKKWVKATSKS